MILKYDVPTSRISGLAPITLNNFIELAKMLQIQLVPVSGDQFGMLPDELEKHCNQAKIHGIFLMPSCCNPTTIMISDFRKRELADVIRKHDLILIEDDIYAFLTAGFIPDYQQSMFNLLPEQSVYICSTSKSICSGLRVAYMVYGDALREKNSKSIFNINVKTSPGKSSVFLLKHLPKSTKLALGVFGLCLDLQTHPTSLASNWIRVPQVKHLPPASFRFHLTMDTLLRLTVDVRQPPFRTYTL